MENNVETEIRPKDDPEYFGIKCCAGFGNFVEYMKDKSLEALRLPVNNPKAYNYLRWLNQHWVENDDGNFLNYVLNLWDSTPGKKRVRPPTPRELAVACSRKIVQFADNPGIDETERNLFIDFNAESIRDAYHYWNYPIWIVSGLAGCIMVFGTFEDNHQPGDEDNYITYEEELNF